jgi:hypothetical protein
MTLVAVAGDKGSGKTLLMTLLAVSDDRQVYSNYKLNIDRYHNLTPSGLMTIEGSSLVMIDEAYIWLESRASGQNTNLFLSHVMFQSRKRSSDWVISMQLNRTVDIRFREMCDLYIECKRVDEGFVYSVTKTSVGKVIARFMISNELATKIYPYYDTLEIIDSNRYMMALLKSDLPELNKIINKIISELKDTLNVTYMKKENLEDWLLRNEYPPELTKYVYNRMVSGG